MLNENMEIKTAWIIHDKKIISFHEIESATLYVEEEPGFWKHIVELISAGYKIQ